jgi:hypothetical protein
MPDDIRVFSGLELSKELVKLKTGLNKVIKRASSERSGGSSVIVGGDGDVGGAEGSPAIIIEKDGERISKILVKCPCGRHAELLCEYEEGS